MAQLEIKKEQPTSPLKLERSVVLAHARNLSLDSEPVAGFCLGRDLGEVVTSSWAAFSLSQRPRLAQGLGGPRSQR